MPLKPNPESWQSATKCYLYINISNDFFYSCYFAQKFRSALFWATSDSAKQYHIPSFSSMDQSLYQCDNHSFLCVIQRHLKLVSWGCSLNALRNRYFTLIIIPATLKIGSIKKVKTGRSNRHTKQKRSLTSGHLYSKSLWTCRFCHVADPAAVPHCSWRQCRPDQQTGTRTHQAWPCQQAGSAEWWCLLQSDSRYTGAPEPL